MTGRHWLSFAMVVLVVCGMSAAVRAATADDAAMGDAIGQLQSQLETLRAEQAAKRQRLSRIEAQSGDSWLNERRAEEVKALVHEVLADADTRASLLQDGMTAGHNGKHFFLASADGSFLLELSGQIQIRYIYNSREGAPLSPTALTDEDEFGMQIRRTKIQFVGHVASPKLHYAVQLAVGEDDNSVFADRIVIGYDLTDDLYIWAGEDKAPFLREEITHSSRQLAVDRSLVNSYFTVGKAQGVGLTWSSDMFRVAGMINDGAYSGDGDATAYGLYEALSPSPSSKDFDDDNTDFAATGRVDVLIMGDWQQMDDFSSWAGEEMAVFLGGGLHYQTGESGTTAADDNVLLWTVDGSVEVNGLSLYVAYVGANIDADSGSGADPWGITVQGAYNIPLNNGDSVEPFVRWEHLDLDDNLGVSSIAGYDDEIDLLTAGGNYYFNGHNAKLTADVVWIFDALPASATNIGLLPNASDGDDQIALRVQFQLLY